MFGLPKVPRQLSFDEDAWEEEKEANLVMEDSWQVLLDDSEVRHQKDRVWVPTKKQVQSESSLTNKSCYVSRLVLPLSLLVWIGVIKQSFTVELSCKFL